MMTDFIREHLDEDGILTLLLDVPGEKVNTLQAALIPALKTILTRLQQQPPKGVVIRSDKPDNFIAGADIRMLDACQTADEARELSAGAQALCDALAAVPCPVVAAIHGSCLGGGLELALACDYRVASDSSVTRLGLPEIRLGLIPGAGGTQRLTRQVGLPLALDLMLTGRSLSASAACRAGLVNEVVDAAHLMTAARRWIARGKVRAVEPPRRYLRWLARWSPARELVLRQTARKVAHKTRSHHATGTHQGSNSSPSNYPAPAALLEVVATGLRDGMTAGLACEARRFGELMMTPASVAMRHLFHLSRQQKKTGIFADVTPCPVNAVGVLGAGLMGSGIAWVTLMEAQLPVRLKETGYPALQHGVAYLRRELANRIRRHKLDHREAGRRQSLLSTTLDYRGFARLPVVLEAVFEELTLKRQMIAEVQAVGGAGQIFASNTSSLPIATLAEGARYPSRVIGLHYFSPVDRMPLVEVIPHAGTDPEVVATVVALARRQGKTPIVVGDVAGFYVNRILSPYMNEAVRILFEGETIEDIDEALVCSGFPVGPLTLLDEVGLDVAARISPVMEAAHGERFAAPALLGQMLAAGRKGRKSGCGFYRYPVDGRKRADGRLYDLLQVPPVHHLGSQRIADRCLWLMLNEAVRCLDEGVIHSAQDGDIGAVFGIGFPPFLGGPFFYMDQLGLDKVVATLQALAERHGERYLPCAGLLQRAAGGSGFYPPAQDSIKPADC